MLIKIFAMRKLIPGTVTSGRTTKRIIAKDYAFMGLFKGAPAYWK